MTEQPFQNITFPSNGGTAHGYLAVPESGSGPGLIVIQEWWGLDDSLKKVVDRFAAEGFVALAPDLYGGRVAHDSDEAGQMLSSLPVEQSTKDLSGGVDFLLGHEAVTSSTVGVVGYCMGGAFALLLAAQEGDRVSAAVPYYGVGPGTPESYAGITAAVQGHYGNQDQMMPADDARKTEEQIRSESGAEVEFFYYDAGHAFMNPDDKMGTPSPSWPSSVVTHPGIPARQGAVDLRSPVHRGEERQQLGGEQLGGNLCDVVTYVGQLRCRDRRRADLLERCSGEFHPPLRRRRAPASARGWIRPGPVLAPVGSSER